MVLFFRERAIGEDIADASLPELAALYSALSKGAVPIGTRYIPQYF
jgi:hypothetical protein